MWDSLSPKQDLESRGWNDRNLGIIVLSPLILGETKTLWDSIIELSHLGFKKIMKLKNDHSGRCHWASNLILYLPFQPNTVGIYCTYSSFSLLRLASKKWLSPCFWVIIHRKVGHSWTVTDFHFSVTKELGDSPPATALTTPGQEGTGQSFRGSHLLNGALVGRKT